MKYFKSAWMLSQSLSHAHHSGDFFKSQYTPQVQLRYSELRKSIRGPVFKNWHTKFLIKRIELLLKQADFFEADLEVNKLIIHIEQIIK